MPAGFPEDFNPEAHETRRMEEDIGEGVTILSALVAKKSGDDTRCWDCRKAPDGTIDCVRIDCPAHWPPHPTTHLNEVLKA
jgi:hypothetical protein